MAQKNERPAPAMGNRPPLNVRLAAERSKDSPAGAPGQPALLFRQVCDRRGRFICLERVGVAHA